MVFDFYVRVGCFKISFLDTSALKQFITAAYPLKEEELENFFVQFENVLADLKGLKDKFPATHPAI